MIGAGGLGCEILKCLAYSNFKNIDIIDMDTIDISNLNRQFLFREKDVGRMKAEVAKEFILKKKPDLNIKSHTCAIQEKDSEFFNQFKIVIAGLDNIKARRWINALLHELVEFDEETEEIIPSSVIPLVDGGTEGLKGQSRVIIPYITACFECSLEMFQQNDKLNSYPLCTIADKPRKPEHCVMFVFLSVKDSLDKGKAIRNEFIELFGEDAVDCDNFDQVNFIYDKAKKRGDIFGIEGVSYALTLGVIKNIIPAIASTNCTIAANCVNEAFKLVSLCAPTLNNYCVLNGHRGVYSHTFKLDKKENCPVCDATEYNVTIDKNMTLQDFINRILVGGEQLDLQLEKPSITTTDSTLFMQKPESLRKATEKNLDKKMSKLIESNDVIFVTDPLYPAETTIDIQVNFA